MIEGARLRFPDEFARHKTLDVIGDLALLGGRFCGNVVARRPSHRGNVALAREIAARSPDAVKAAKRLFNLAAHADDAAVLRAESAEQVQLMRSPNQVEAVRAAMEKRAPVFRG